MNPQPIRTIEEAQAGNITSAIDVRNAYLAEGGEGVISNSGTSFSDAYVHWLEKAVAQAIYNKQFHPTDKRALAARRHIDVCEVMAVTGGRSPGINCRECNKQRAGEYCPDCRFVFHAERLARQFIKLIAAFYGPITIERALELFKPFKDVVTVVDEGGTPVVVPTINGISVQTLGDAAMIMRALAALGAGKEAAIDEI